MLDVARERFAKEVAARALSVRETEHLVKKAQAGVHGSARTKPEENNPEAANILAAEAKLSKRLGAPVKIRSTRTGGVVEIRFSSSEDLARLFDTLMQSRYQ
jgi:ParB-like chromosome segregation protein Spo0J